MTDDETWDGSISWTKASTYNRCGRQFRYKYVEDIEQDEEMDDGRRTGIDFHEFMDEYYDLCPDGPNAETAVTLAQEMWDERRQEKYRPYIEKWHQWNEWLHQKFGEYWKPVYTEKWIEVEWEDAIHHGYIDAIRWCPEREAYGVVDYKPAAKDNSRIKGQVAYYAEILLEVSDLLDEEVTWGGVYGYKDGNYKTWDVHWASTKASKRKVNSLISLDNGYEPEFGFHCSFCDFQEECTIEEMNSSDEGNSLI